MAYFHGLGNVKNAECNTDFQCVPPVYNFDECYSIIQHQNQLILNQQKVLEELREKIDGLQQQVSLLGSSSPTDPSLGTAHTSGQNKVSPHKSERLINYCQVLDPSKSYKNYTLKGNDYKSHKAVHPQVLKCYWCRIPNHLEKNCRRKLGLCFRCGSPTHLLSKCSYPGRNRSGSQSVGSSISNKVTSPKSSGSRANKLIKSPFSERARKKKSASLAVVSSYITLPDVSLMKPYSPSPVPEVSVSTEPETECILNASGNSCFIVPKEIGTDCKTSGVSNGFITETDVNNENCLLDTENSCLTERENTIVPATSNEPGTIGDQETTHSTEQEADEKIDVPDESVLSKIDLSDSEPENSCHSVSKPLPIAPANNRSFRVGVVRVADSADELLKEEKEFKCMAGGCQKFGEHQCAICVEYDQLTLFCSDKCIRETEHAHNHAHLQLSAVISVHKFCKLKEIPCRICLSLLQRKTDFKVIMDKYKSVRQNWFQRRNP